MKITLSSPSQGRAWQFTHPPLRLIELFTIAKKLGFDGVLLTLSFVESNRAGIRPPLTIPTIISGV